MLTGADSGQLGRKIANTCLMSCTVLYCTVYQTQRKFTSPWIFPFGPHHTLHIQHIQQWSLLQIILSGCYLILFNTERWHPPVGVWAAARPGEKQFVKKFHLLWKREINCEDWGRSFEVWRRGWIRWTRALYCTTVLLCTVPRLSRFSCAAFYSC